MSANPTLSAVLTMLAVAVGAALAWGLNASVAATGGAALVIVPSTLLERWADRIERRSAALGAVSDPFAERAGVRRRVAGGAASSRLLAGLALGLAASRFWLIARLLALAMSRVDAQWRLPLVAGFSAAVGIDWIVRLRRLRRGAE
ncbi:MAG: hypothetical protein AAF648_07110 [Pseudomonadota bacterium]